MDETTLFLVKLLAQQDAIFMPPSAGAWLTNRAKTAALGRERFFKHGLPIQAGDTSGAGRVAHGRLLQEMADAGQVTIRRARGAMLPFVRLTDTAEEKTRALVGANSVWWALHFVGELLEKPVCRSWDGRLWVSERDFLPLGADRWARQTLFLTALPGAARRWLELNSDGMGVVSFRELPAGVKALQDLDTAPDEPPYSQEAYRLYFAELNAAIEVLNSATPDSTSEVGAIPLPVSMGLPIERPAAGKQE